LTRAAYAAGGVAGLMILVGLAVWQFRPMIMIGVNYKAKVLCSSVFVSGRAPEDVLNEDLFVDGYELLSYFKAEIDRTAKTVSVSAMGLWPRVAVFRSGLGCVLALDEKPASLQTKRPSVTAFPKPSRATNELWPEGDRVNLRALSSDVDREALAGAMNSAFSETDPARLQRTRAVVVVHRGRIIAERYADGFSAATALPGWSMSKSVLNALFGIAMGNAEVAGQLKRPLTFESTDLLPEWRKDSRRAIRLGSLLRMSSGLAFAEDYEDFEGDALQMLFATADIGRFVASKTHFAPPGKTWRYSSGTSNILSYVLRRHFKRRSDYLALPERYLFGPLGMRSAVLETDAAGTFVASSFMYASARDWARFGLLYLQDGLWAGRKILPDGWVAMSIKPARVAPDGRYGLHFWLKLPDSPALGEPPMPDDSFYMLGHAGQVVAIVPSRRLVIVRLGLARRPGDWHPERILGAITAAIPPNT
jgi:CubicO group peptidase (beta-lactamase class C family)